MVAPLVVEAMVTMTAPFWAPLLVEVEMVGAAAAVGVGVGEGDEPPPHPQTSETDKNIVLNTPAPIRIFESPFFATEQAVLAPKNE